MNCAALDSDFGMLSVVLDGVLRQFRLASHVVIVVSTSHCRLSDHFQFCSFLHSVPDCRGPHFSPNRPLTPLTSLQFFSTSGPVAIYYSSLTLSKKTQAERRQRRFLTDDEFDCKKISFVTEQLLICLWLLQRPGCTRRDVSGSFH